MNTSYLRFYDLLSSALPTFQPFQTACFLCHINFLTNLNCLFCCSVAKSCLSLCDFINCIMPGFPVLHYLPKFAQPHVHWFSHAFQQSHPLLPHSPLALSLSQNQNLFQWVGSSHQVAFSISPSNEYLGLISFRIDWFDLLVVQGTLKRVVSSTRVQKHQFFSAQPSLWSNYHILYLR